MISNNYCKRCGIEIDLEIDNPLCLCDECYDELEDEDDE